MGDGKLEEIEMWPVTHNMPPNVGHPCGVRGQIWMEERGGSMAGGTVCSDCEAVEYHHTMSSDRP